MRSCLSVASNELLGGYTAASADTSDVQPDGLTPRDSEALDIRVLKLQCRPRSIGML